MRQAQLESTRATLKITFTKAIEAEKPDVLKQVKFQIKSDNAYNGAVIANKDYTLNQVIKVGVFFCDKYSRYSESRTICNRYKLN